MDRYLDDVRELERRIALAADSPLARIDVPDKPNGIPADFEEHAILMFDLLALAWEADLTRIGTFMVARELSNRLYPKSGVNEGFHNASHHSGIPANIDRLAKLNEYHTRTTIAYFLRKLANTPDGDGSLLDHSIVMYGSGMGNPNQHDHDPLADVARGRRLGAAARRAARSRRGRHARREPARDRARQARRTGRVIRRRHQRARDLIGLAHDDIESSARGFGDRSDRAPSARRRGSRSGCAATERHRGAGAARAVGRRRS